MPFLILHIFLLLAVKYSNSQPLPQPSYFNISDGIPILGYSASGSSSFYRFIAPLPFSPISIVVLPISGSPSLYISVGKYWDPEPTNYLLSASGDFGDEIIVIPANYTPTTLGDTCNPAQYTTCYVNINVYGSRSSNFSLSLTTIFGTQSLTPGLPTIGSVTPGNVNEYSLSLLNAPASVTFRVSPTVSTSLFGLYLSTSPGINVNNASTYCASTQTPARITGVETLTLLNTSSTCFCSTSSSSNSNCTFFVAIYNSNTISSSPSLDYSIVATTSDTLYTILYDGVPFSAGSGHEGLPGSQFLFNARLDTTTTTSSAVEIIASPFSGSIKLYVLVGDGTSNSSSSSSTLPPGPNTLPSTSFFTTMGGPGPQVLSLSTNDPRIASLCPSSSSSSSSSCPVYIGVYTTSLASSWSIIARLSSYVQLTSSVPLEDIAPAGTVTFYRFTIPNGALSSPVFISVSTLSGDASLYVGCDTNNATTRPSGIAGSYIWSTVIAGTEKSINIDPSVDNRACSSSLTTCSYYIGVTSSDSTRSVSYTILARTNSSALNPIPLTLGEVIPDAVLPFGTVYYELQWPFDATGLPTTSITISGQSTDGAIDIKATLGPFNSSAVPLWPYIASHSSATSPGEWESLVISINDALWNTSQVCFSSSSCIVTIAIYGNTTLSTSHYLITATADLLQLVDGVTVEGSVGPAPDIVYFRFDAIDASPFQIDLAVLSGDADLFVSYNALPSNASVAQWTSRRGSNEFINVQWTEPFLDPSRNSISFPLSFYIGVSGWNDYCAFSLVVSTNPFTALSPGIPNTATARAGVLTVFLFYVPGPDITGGSVGFNVALSPISGDSNLRMYINTVNKTQPCAHCGWPYCRTTPCDGANIGNYNRRWSSEEAANPLFCEVDAMDANYETSTTYVIAVLATTRDSLFDIVASYTSSIIYLQDQIPMPGSVYTDEYRFYVLDITNTDVSLSVSLTTLAGEGADVFVSVNSTNRRPTADFYDKASIYGGGGTQAQVIFFSWDELNECPGSSVALTIACNAYISVRGHSSSLNDNSSTVTSYILQADAAKENQTAYLLEDGVRIVGVVKPSDYEEFYALVDLPPLTPYSVELTPYGTAKLTLYVTLDGSRPGPTNYAYRTNGNSGPEQITISPPSSSNNSTSAYNNSCTLRCIVHCPFMGYVQFDILYASTASSQLLPSIPAYSVTQVTWKRYFTLLVQSPLSASDAIDISFTGLAGNRIQVAVGVKPLGNDTWRPSFNGPTSDSNTCFSSLLTTLNGRSEFFHSPTSSSACAALCPGPLQSCQYMVGIFCPGTPYKEPPCALYTTATTSELQSVHLLDGQPQFGSISSPITTLPPQISGHRFYSFDISMFAGGSLGNITIGALSSNGFVQILATNIVGALPTSSGLLFINGGGGGSITPTNSSNGGFWNSNSTAPPGFTATLTLSSFDPSIYSCPACTLLTISVYSPSYSSSSNDVTFWVQSSTDLGTPQRLLLSQPSQPVTGDYRMSNSFVFTLGSTTNDLIVDTTVLTGYVAVSVDPYSQPICTIGRAPQRVIQCSGLWTDVNANNGNPPLRIFANNPCSMANQSLPCDPSTAWRIGPYFVTTIIFWSPSTFIITATQPGLVVALTDGEIQSAATSFDSPAVYSFAQSISSSSSSQILTYYSITAGDRRLTVYVSACLQSSCTDDDLTPGPNSPSNLIIYTGNVNSRSTSTFSVDGSALCNNGGNEEPCVFILSLYPPQGCVSSTCAALFSISASATPPSPPFTPSPSPQSSPSPPPPTPPSTSPLPPNGPGNNNNNNSVNLDDILAGVFLGGGVLLCSSVYFVLHVLRNGLPCRKNKGDSPRDGGGLLILREKYPYDDENGDDDIEEGSGQQQYKEATTATSIISSIISSRSSSGANSKTTSPVLIAQRRDMREERIRQLRGSLDVQTTSPFVTATVAAGRPISPLLLS